EPRPRVGGWKVPQQRPRVVADARRPGIHGGARVDDDSHSRRLADRPRRRRAGWIGHAGQSVDPDGDPPATPGVNDFVTTTATGAASSLFTWISGRVGKYAATTRAYASWSGR